MMYLLFYNVNNNFTAYGYLQPIVEKSNVWRYSSEEKDFHEPNNVGLCETR